MSSNHEREREREGETLMLLKLLTVQPNGDEKPFLKSGTKLVSITYGATRRHRLLARYTTSNVAAAASAAVCSYDSLCSIFPLVFIATSFHIFTDRRRWRWFLL